MCLLPFLRLYSNPHNKRRRIKLTALQSIWKHAKWGECERKHSFSKLDTKRKKKTHSQHAIKNIIYIIYNNVQRFGITFYSDAFLLLFNNGYFTTHKNSMRHLLNRFSNPVKQNWPSLLIHKDTQRRFEKLFFFGPSAVYSVVRLRRSKLGFVSL